MSKLVASVIESLEPRLLMSESASAQISLVSTTGSSASPTYDYSITLKNTGTTDIGTFWFGWVPGQDFLPSVPTSESSPAGWGNAAGTSTVPTVTGSGNSTDGSAIQWVAQTVSAALAPGQSLGGFAFSTADSPSALVGQSPSHPGELVLTSVVYSGAPFSDAGFQFVASGLGSSAATPGIFAPTILKSTIPATVAAGAAIKSEVLVRIENQSTAATDSSVSLSIYATIGGSLANSSTLLGTISHPLKLAAGKKITLAVPIDLIPSSLSVGSYTLVAHATDAAGHSADSPTGPAVNVALQPSSSLSETIASVSIPPNVTAGQKTHAVVKLKIDNGGSGAFKGSTTVALYLSTDGTVDSTATEIIGESRVLKIRAGKTTLLSLPVKTIPTVAAGSYYLAAQVTEPGGGSSTTDASSQINVASAS